MMQDNSELESAHGGTDNGDASSVMEGSAEGSSTGTPSTIHNGSNGSSTGTNGSGTRVPEEIVASKENLAVSRSKHLFLSMLFLATLVAGTLTWHWSRSSERDDFEVQFSDFAFEIEDISLQNLDKILASSASFSTTLTSTAISLNQTFPNVTVPHFEVRGEKYLAVTDGILISYAPIVTDPAAWNKYSFESQDWITESYALRGDTSVADPIGPLHNRKDDGSIIPISEVDTISCALWQESEAPKDTSVINYNLLDHDVFRANFEKMVKTHEVVLSEVFDPSSLLGSGALLETDDDFEVHPESILLQPVFEGLDTANGRIVGSLVSVLPWDLYFSGLLHNGADAIICVLDYACGGQFTYQIDGPKATYLGPGDLHDSAYNSMVHDVDFVLDSEASPGQNENECFYTLHVYPSPELEDVYHTSEPIILTIVVVSIFFFTTFAFVCYDWLVQRRQEKLHNAALRSNAIVSSLFPAEVRDRLYQDRATDQKDKQKTSNKAKKSGYEPGAKLRLQNYLEEGTNTKDESQDETHAADIPEMFETKPIADLFPNTTVMFADIAGFTAWSSVREPSQVFTLLETVYRAFDIIAKRRRVFKVETVGDCYVAVTGLPVARKDHAVAMCRFARDCMQRMKELSHHLEVSLGPDTGDLAMRFGLHSGPVTAGVLRGDKSRFQLFGDTVNTAARVESTGTKNRIHLSRETAEQLEIAGKSAWYVPRTDKVVAKGKGEMKTFWLLPRDGSSAAEFQEEIADSSGRAIRSPKSSEGVIPPKVSHSSKLDRLVDWNVDVLKKLLCLIIAKNKSMSNNDLGTNDHDKVSSLEAEMLKWRMPLKEVQEIVVLPAYDGSINLKSVRPRDINVPENVQAQLRDYVASVATMYRENAFHNFEHASHVTMSVSKLLSRIVAPDVEVDMANLEDVDENLHDHTYGITSDPLTQFAVVISALIHDVDHVGVSNVQLAEENRQLGSHYENKSVAEQNSVDLGWMLLMEPRFRDLRYCLYGDNVNDLERFRHLVINTVLATDIFDKELSALRKKRWDKAFNQVEDEIAKDHPIATVNRKATIVIEHLIQASDVAHTMQHWHIYQKWNERLFAEMMTAYRTGRSKNDPSKGWYEGELGFFDFYIIPLAKKLKDCGVFGVSSDEYLNYALENRREWASKGKDVVDKLIAKYGSPSDGDANKTESPKAE